MPVSGKIGDILLLKVKQTKHLEHQNTSKPKPSLRRRNARLLQVRTKPSICSAPYSGAVGPLSRVLVSRPSLFMAVGRVKRHLDLLLPPQTPIGPAKLHVCLPPIVISRIASLELFVYKLELLRSLFHRHPKLLFSRLVSYFFIFHYVFPFFSTLSLSPGTLDITVSWPRWIHHE